MKYIVEKVKIKIKKIVGHQAMGYYYAIKNRVLSRYQDPLPDLGESFEMKDLIEEEGELEEDLEYTYKNMRGHDSLYFSESRQGAKSLSTRFKEEMMKWRS